LAHSRHTKHALGLTAFQSAGEDIEFARQLWFRTIERVRPVVLDRLNLDVYQHGVAQGRMDVASAPIAERLQKWASSFSLVHQSAPAPWVLREARLTMSWWRRGKPSVRDFFTARDGERPLFPLRFVNLAFSGKAPTVVLSNSWPPTWLLFEIDPYKTDEEITAAYKNWCRRNEKQLPQSIEQSRAGVQKTAKTSAENYELAVRFQTDDEFSLSAHCKERDLNPRTANVQIKAILDQIGLTRRNRAGRPRN
jgi:hypothetical protein